VIAMPATIGERTTVAHSSSLKSAFVVIQILLTGRMDSR
jgi:hypothetical protein